MTDIRSKQIVYSTPVATAPAGSAPVKAAPMGSASVGSTPVATAPAGSARTIFARLATALAVAFALALVPVLSSCMTTTNPADSGPQSTAELPTTGEPTKESPIVIDKANKTVRIYTEVNGTYFTESTRHGIVFKDGSNGEKSILRGYANEKLFYQALLDIGAKAGDNLTADDMKATAGSGKPVEGDFLTVTVSFDSTKNLAFEKIVDASEQRPMVIRFGGNLASAEKNNTGCVLCLDSCATGITSNAAWETGATQNDMVKFYGNKDILPADGSPVIVSFKLA